MPLVVFMITNMITGPLAEERAAGGTGQYSAGNINRVQIALLVHDACLPGDT